MADLQRILPDDHPLDQQLQDLLAFREGRLVQAGPHPTAERFEVRPNGLRRLALRLQPLLLVALGHENLAATLNLFATGLQLGQVDHLGLVGVDQALLLTAKPLELGLPPRARGATAIVLL